MDHGVTDSTVGGLAALARDRAEAPVFGSGGGTHGAGLLVALLFHGCLLTQ